MSTKLQKNKASRGKILRNSNPSRRKLIAASLFMMVGIVTCVSVVFYLQYPYVKMRSMLPGPNVAVNTYSSPTPNTTFHQVVNVRIPMLTRNGSEIVRVSPEGPNIVRWNDSVIYILDNQKVIEEDVYTGNTTTLFSNSDLNQTLSRLFLIEDDLYISSTKYLRKGNLYVFNLRSKNHVTSIATVNARIVKMIDRYWVIESEGDGCAGTVNYSLLNPKTYQITNIANTIEGCTTGDVFVGFDNQERMLLAKQDDIPVEGAQVVNGRYLSIVAFSLNSPDTRVDIIAEREMPPNIYDLYYDISSNILWLFGDAIYHKNLENGSLTVRATIPKKWQGAMYSKSPYKSEALCVTRSSPSSVPLEYAELNKHTFEYELYSNNCLSFDNPSYAFREENKRIEEANSYINLPDPYKIVLK